MKNDVPNTDLIKSKIWTKELIKKYTFLKRYEYLEKYIHSNPTMKYTDLKVHIENISDVSRITAYKVIKALKSAGILRATGHTHNAILMLTDEYKIQRRKVNT